MMLTLKRFIAERHLVYLKRKTGQLAPWTDDAVLQKYFFTNVYRRLDKTSVTLIRLLFGRCYDQDFMFNVVLHRLLSRREFSESLGYVREFHHFRHEYDRRKAAGLKLRTEAFTSCQSEAVLLETVWYVWTQGDLIWESISQERTVENAYGVVNKIPGIGRFLAWQIAQDLYMFGAVEASEGFVVLGPGADLGLKLSGNRDFWQVLKDVNEDRPGWLPCIEAEDLEHVLCEYAKYVKLNKNTGRKRLYRGSAEKEKSCLNTEDNNNG